VLFEVFLTLGVSTTRPTHPIEADSALQVRTSRPILGNWCFAFEVGALLGAMFYEQKRELCSTNFVLIADVFDLLLMKGSNLYVYPVEQTALERVSSLFAIQTKQKFAVLTATRVLLLIVVGNTGASRLRAPSHVLHLRDGVVQTKFFVLFKNLFVET